MFWQKKLFHVWFFSPPGLTPKGAGHSQVGVSELKVWRPLQYHQTFLQKYESMKKMTITLNIFLSKVCKYKDHFHYVSFFLKSMKVWTPYHYMEYFFKVWKNRNIYFLLYRFTKTIYAWMVGQCFEFTMNW